jgi:hypothetical protein
MFQDPKRCTKCNTAKPLVDGFYVTHRKRDGTPRSYSALCRQCHNQKSHANEKKRAAKQRTQRAALAELKAKYLPPSEPEAPAPPLTGGVAPHLPAPTSFQTVFDQMAAAYAVDIFQTMLDLATGRVRTLKPGQQPPNLKMLELTAERLLGRLNDRSPTTDDRLATLVRALHTTQQRLDRGPAGGVGAGADLGEPLPALEIGGLPPEPGAVGLSPGPESPGDGSPDEAGGGGAASWEVVLRRHGITE